MTNVVSLSLSKIKDIDRLFNEIMITTKDNIDPSWNRSKIIVALLYYFLNNKKSKKFFSELKKVYEEYEGKY